MIREFVRNAMKKIIITPMKWIISKVVSTASLIMVNLLIGLVRLKIAKVKILLISKPQLPNSTH